jgi:hypothetical protein
MAEECVDQTQLDTAVADLLGLKTFTVQASETVWYSVKVRAESEEVVREMVDRGEIDFPSNSICGGDNFEIDDITEEI